MEQKDDEVHLNKQIEEKDDELHLNKQIEAFVQTSTRKLLPQLERVERAFKTAASSEIKIYLREHGINQDILSDEEYNFLVAAVEKKSPADSSSNIIKFVKKYCYRQLRRIHTPRQTASYLSYSFRDTLIYFVFFSFYLILVYAACHRLIWSICITIRLIMTLHLGYYYVIWITRTGYRLYMQVKELISFIWHVIRYIPAVFFETMHVLFNVFIGWPLLGSICGIIFMLYIVPIVLPEMGLSSVFVELYIMYVGDPPKWVKVATLFV